jgi:hypothetical protein
MGGSLVEHAWCCSAPTVEAEAPAGDNKVLNTTSIRATRGDASQRLEPEVILAAVMITTMTAEAEVITQKENIASRRLEPGVILAAVMFRTMLAPTEDITQRSERKNSFGLHQ